MLRVILPILLLFALTSQSAAAHTGMAITTPDHDEVLSSAPSQLVFEFMAYVTITNIRLEISTGAHSGEQLQIHLPRNSIGQSTAFGTTITLVLPALEPAAYLVTWQAISLDGHVIVDDFNFTVSD